MIYVDVEQIYSDFNSSLTALTLTGSMFNNSLLKIVVNEIDSFFNKSIILNQTFVSYNPNENDIKKCLIKVEYEDVVIRSINPFLENKIKYFFEEIEDELTIFQIELLQGLFPKVYESNLTAEN